MRSVEIYFRGQGVPRDEKEGLTWITKAAMDGHPGAQYLLGEAYEVGGTLKSDKVLACYWYTAALSGDEAVLREADPEFDPKTALAVLMTRMTRREIAAGNALLKKSPPPSAAGPDGGAAARDVGSAQGLTPRSARASNVAVRRAASP